jgi:predicted kinase
LIEDGIGEGMGENLIVVAGLPGTGKTTTANKLSSTLGYVLVDQNEIRRKLGMKNFPTPKEQEPVLREMDRLIAENLLAGKGVVVESAHTRAFRRHQLYGIASACGAGALTVECVCSEELAKKRMGERGAGDELVSDPGDWRVYDKIKDKWEDIEDDFKTGEQQGHVSHLKFDSEKGRVEGVDERDEEFVGRVREVLLSD